MSPGAPARPWRGERGMHEMSMVYECCGPTCVSCPVHGRGQASHPPEPQVHRLAQGHPSAALGVQAPERIAHVLLVHYPSHALSSLTLSYEYTI